MIRLKSCLSSLAILASLGAFVGSAQAVELWAGRYQGSSFQGCYVDMQVAGNGVWLMDSRGCYDNNVYYFNYSSDGYYWGSVQDSRCQLVFHSPTSFSETCWNPWGQSASQYFSRL